MRYDNFIPEPRLVEIRSRGRLPHWQVDNALYFVTFRLSDALPKEVALRLKHERDVLVRTASRAVDRARIDAAFEVLLDRELDQGRGSCVLGEHAEVVAGALRHFDGSRYTLHAWCVMPNHVHVLLHVELGRTMPAILHSWKSYTAHRIGRPVWQREYFDRVIRSPQEFARTVAYIRTNPAKAGLGEWPWVG